MPTINFYLEDASYQLKKKKLIRKWILATISHEKAEIDNISYIFCTDSYLYKLNTEYLNHDTLTDIITFQYNSPDEAIQSDIFISIERVKENAKLYNQRLLDEVHRILIHGTLHLLGYKDKSDNEKAEMTAKENYYLSLRPEDLLNY